MNQSIQPSPPATSPLRKATQWQGTHRGIAFHVIVHESEAYPDGRLYPEKPAWCAYIFMRESQCVDFPSLWLPDEVKQVSSGREYVSHNYMEGIVGSIKMHGGLTYYKKHGHTEGHRCVEVGCDYQHYCDEGQDYDLQYVILDTTDSIDRLFAEGVLKEDSH